MKNLDNLIRLHQWRLDEKRRVVTELETLIGRLNAEIEQLEKNLKAEQQVASRNTEAATGYGGYASAVIARREKLRKSLEGLEAEMVQATDDVAAAFQEFKRFDLLRARNQEKAQKEKKRIQQAEIDEAGLNVYRRATTN